MVGRIEAGVQTVRFLSKGSFKDTNVRDICKSIEEHKINVISNFIVGLPNDNYQTMIATMQLAQIKYCDDECISMYKTSWLLLYSEAKNKEKIYL